MTKITKNNIDILFEYLDELFPDPKCELNFSNAYELVIAVMLSAQTTDKSVNKVTDVLFKRYPTLKELDDAPLSDIEDIIKSIGLYKNKAKNIKGITHDLLTRFNGEVPSDRELLTTLPGVGEKTAGVVRAVYFQIPELPVDTHVARIAKRLSLVKESDEPLEIEKKLKRIVPEDRWIKTHHQLIHFGRYFCKAKNPMCENCKISGFCKKI